MVWVHLPLGQVWRLWVCFRWKPCSFVSSTCFCYMNWRICDQSGICDPFLHCYQYWRILFFFQISELNFTPREGRETPLNFTPGGPLQSILGKSGKILLKSGQFVKFLFTVHFQMLPQITCIIGFIVTLVAFDWLFCVISNASSKSLH